MPTLSRIRVYPIKSLDALELSAVNVLANGALEHDRRFRLVDRAGQIVNGKRTADLHRIRCEYDPRVTFVLIGLQDDTTRIRFSLIEQLPELAEWLSDFLTCVLRIEENREGGFPDDIASPGPTLVSRASLVQAAAWFNGIDEAQVRERMRANLEVDGCEPFWEDQLFGADAGIAFGIGEVRFLGVNPCARCVVPSRDPRTGVRWNSFQADFVEHRRASLPAWAATEHFDHYYRFAVNSRGLGPGRIHVGEAVVI